MAKMIATHQEPHQFEVYLHQLANGVYQVTYGAQVTAFEASQYREAVEEFRNCQDHAMSCNGMLEDDLDD